MFERIIREIEICLNNDATLAALVLALSLPDTLGKIEYGESGTEERYTKWIDKFAPAIVYGRSEVTIPMKTEGGDYGKKKVPSDGEIIYHIRNTLMHESTTKIKPKKPITHIRLYDEKANEYGLYVHGIGSSMYDGDLDSLTIHYSISIRGLINGIVASSKDYYKKHESKMLEYIEDWTIKPID